MEKYKTRTAKIQSLSNCKKQIKKKCDLSLRQTQILQKPQAKQKEDRTLVYVR